MSSEKPKRKQFRKKRQESSDEDDEEAVGPFTPRGYRTRPIPYFKGASGKQSATRYPIGAKKPVVLLVMDSNGRNIVNPQKVSPSRTASFELAAISIPGGKTFHACTELSNLDKCRGNVSHVVLALGTNDMSEGMFVLNKFQSRVEALMRVAWSVYPDAQISLNSILSRHDEYGGVVPEANKIIKKVTENHGIEYLRIKVEKNPWYWSDFIHLSDEGLRNYMNKFEQQVERKLFGNENYVPAKPAVEKRFSFSGPTTYDKIRATTAKRRTFSEINPTERIESSKHTVYGRKYRSFEETPTKRRLIEHSVTGVHSAPRPTVIPSDGGRASRQSRMTKSECDAPLSAGVSDDTSAPSESRYTSRRVERRPTAGSRTESNPGPKYRALGKSRNSSTPASQASHWVSGTHSTGANAPSFSPINSLPHQGTSAPGVTSADHGESKTSYPRMSSHSAPNVTTVPHGYSAPSTVPSVPCATGSSATPKRRPVSASVRRNAGMDDTGSRRLFQNIFTSHCRTVPNASGGASDARSQSSTPSRKNWDESVGSFLEKIKKKNKSDELLTPESPNVSKSPAKLCRSDRKSSKKRVTSGVHDDSEACHRSSADKASELHDTRVVEAPQNDHAYSSWRDKKDGSLNDSIWSPAGPRSHASFEESFDAARPGRGREEKRNVKLTDSDSTQKITDEDGHEERNIEKCRQRTKSYQPTVERTAEKKHDPSVDRKIHKFQKHGKNNPDIPTNLLHSGAQVKDKSCKVHRTPDTSCLILSDVPRQKMSGGVGSVDGSQDDAQHRKVKLDTKIRRARSDGKLHSATNFCRAELSRFLALTPQKLNKTWSAGQEGSRKRKLNHDDGLSDDEEELTPRKRHTKEKQRSRKVHHEDNSETDKTFSQRSLCVSRGDHRRFSFKNKNRDALLRSLPRAPKT